MTRPIPESRNAAPHATRTTAARRRHRRILLLSALTALLLALFWAPAAAAQDEASEAYDSEGAPAHVDRGQALVGKHMFRSFCASCHGTEGKGDGSIAEMLRVAPADLTVLAKENGGEFPFQRSVAVIDGRVKVKGHGSTEMPAWGDAFAEISASDEEVEQKISQLVHFIWSIQEPAESTDG